MDLSLLPNIYDFISKTYPFSKLSELELDSAATQIRISYHTTDDILVDDSLAGVGLFMIKQGMVEEIGKNDGALLACYSEGDTFGFTQLDKEGVSDYKVIFKENTLLYEIPKNVLKLLIKKNHAVAEYFNAKEWIRLYSSHNYADEDTSGEGGSHKKVKDICHAEYSVVTKDTSIQDTAIDMRKTSSDMAMVLEGDKLKGVVTKSDITNKAVANGMDIRSPIAAIMTENAITIDAESSVYEALSTMVLNNIKNIPVLKDSRVCGYVSTVSLLQNSQLQAVYLCKEISKAQDVERLASLSSKKYEIFETLVSKNVQPHTVQKVMSHIADSFAQALLRIAEQTFGKAPVEFAFVCAGSQARNEVQFLSDQDNLIITKTKLDDTQREYFNKLASFVCQGLDKCGYPLCDGNFMASNPAWLCSLDEWKDKFSDWIQNLTQEAILASSVFLDMRLIYGYKVLLRELREHFLEKASTNRRFMAMLVNISTAVSPPLGTFRTFVLTKKGDSDPYLNIKKQAINLIVEIARVYGIESKSDAVDTYKRLEAAVGKGLIREDDYKELSEAYTFLNSVRFNHQLKSLKDGKEMSNNINPEVLSQFERNHLRDAFRIIEKHQKSVKFHFAPSLG